MFTLPPKRWLIAAGVLAVVVLNLIYARSVSQHRDRSSNRTTRQDDLKMFGDKILDFSVDRDGKLPASLDDLIVNRAITLAEVAFYDERQGVRVVRTFRPVPNTFLPGALILVVERYDPVQDEVLAFLLDGSLLVTDSQEISEIISKDNALRHEQGLPEIPLPGPD